MNKKHVLLGWIVGLPLVFFGCDTTPEPVSFYEAKAKPEKLRQIEPLILPAAEPNEQPQTPAPLPEEIRLTVEQCRAWALENNLGLKAELLSPTIASETLSQLRGVILLTRPIL